MTLMPEVPARSARELAPPIMMALLLVLFWAFPFLGFTPYDYGAFIGPWYREILAEGRIGVFAQPFSNYSPPYLYLLSASSLLDGLLAPLTVVKLLSTAGAAWLAFAVYALLKAAGAPDPAKGALWSLLLPTIIFNVPILTQADTFWVAPCVLATAAAVKGNALRMVVWAGIAFAFKAQAIFIAPFVTAMLLRQRAPLWYWTVPALIYAAAMLPARLVGWPAWDLLTVYFRQAAYTSEIAFISNAANWWYVFRLVAAPETALASFWVGYLLAALATAAYWFWCVPRALGKPGLLATAALSALMLPWLLPGMHERFFALAEILTFCLAWAVRDRRSIAVAVLVQAGLVLSVGGWLSDVDWIAPIAIPLVTAALVLLVWRIVRDGSAQRQRDFEEGRAPVLGRLAGN